jgi:NAD(P)-dependent dehydrogenase (short-subunit alcohol dehydrogenase family)
MDVKDKVALITGASTGIGKATAELFAARGAKVALAARSVDKLKEISSGLPDSLAVPIDMRNPKEVRRMVRDTHAHYGRLDVLVNNAGQGLRSPIESIDLADLSHVMSLNLYGPLIAMQAAIPLMRKQGYGTIVNISSGVTRANYPTLAGYAATKSALNMITLTARNELARDGITVSLVYPGLTATDFAKHSLPSGPELKALPNSPIEADSPLLVAERILEAVETGAAEVVLDWIKKIEEQRLKAQA